MRKRGGFTLVEMVLVVGLMVILTGLSGSFYARFLVQNSVDNTVDQIVEDLRKAQIYSISGRAGLAWGVRYADSELILYAQGNPALNERLVINPSIAVTGLGEVYFARVTGIPSATPVIEVSGNNISRQIEINSLGIVSRL